jgi:hypothetical protein
MSFVYWSAKMAEIQTGVDRLIKLVKERKIISMEDAARTLSMDKRMVKNLAEILEDENIVAIKYHLASEVIVDRDFSSSRKAGLSNKTAGHPAVVKRICDLIMFSNKKMDSMRFYEAYSAYKRARAEYLKLFKEEKKKVYLELIALHKRISDSIHQE